MKEMLFALQKALAEKVQKKQTNLVIGSMFNDAVRAQYRDGQVERRKRELEKLGGRFEGVGRSWYDLNVGPFFRPRHEVFTSIVKIRKDWQELQTPLVTTSKDERPQMISKFADGLELSEEHLNAYYRHVVVGEILHNPLEDMQAIFNKQTRFSPASKAFFEVLSNISGYSKKQKTSFKDFMQKREDLSGLVRLPQVFPAVAEWLVQSRNDSQSSRLS